MCEFQQTIVIHRVLEELSGELRKDAPVHYGEMLRETINM